jgi:hypothetical protein
MLEFYGFSEDNIIAMIEDGKTLSFIAESCGKNRSILTRWIQEDEQRSARAREARASASQAWDEKAEQEIEDARDPFELAKAKEKAHHYRWRASKVAPKEYGDKQQVEHSGTLTLEQMVLNSMQPNEPSGG